ncbi:MAG: hypothetical protein JO069_22770 [Verrucomicrobia bacterium]|nr:hypothetical protein [Verrucomicrobiota bacterium]
MSHHPFKMRQAAAVLAVCGWACWAGFGLIERAHAASVRTLSLAEMSRSAEIIADATVQAVQPYWAAPAGARAIRTKVTFAINQAIKGNPGTTLVLEFLGGEVDGRGVRVPGVPQFHPGERYVLFSAGPDKTLVCPVLGFDQGAMRVVHDDESNVDRVFRNWGQPVNASEKFESRVPAVPGVTTRGQLRSAEPVDEFLARVRQAVTQ